ncbi:IS200/IS605 family transposase [uncultured Desulfovibrio sp.]|uniref:IS200/IS605 family transposase n=1 Tax=uncultured Desulfovibrio sp. TaxID=167968 RepID=UPI0026F1F1AD|nr:IS200/IS605 family transposase [uncultured Desulfovibrio sp.]
MTKNSSLIHTVWDCKYHVVWIPKYRRKVLYGKLRHYLGDVLHELARQCESRIIEGHLCIDHIHMCIAIPPKHSVSEVVGFIKGKSAIAIARDVGGKARNFVGQSFWARVVGCDEDVIREYIRNQEAEERRLERISLLK